MGRQTGAAARPSRRVRLLPLESGFEGPVRANHDDPAPHLAGPGPNQTGRACEPVGLGKVIRRPRQGSKAALSSVRRNRRPEQPPAPTRRIIRPCRPEVWAEDEVPAGWASAPMVHTRSARKAVLARRRSSPRYDQPRPAGGAATKCVHAAGGVPGPEGQTLRESQGFARRGRLASLVADRPSCSSRVGGGGSSGRAVDQGKEGARRTNPPRASAWG